MPSQKFGIERPHRANARPDVPRGPRPTAEIIPPRNSDDERERHAITASSNVTGSF